MPFFMRNNIKLFIRLRRHKFAMSFIFPQLIIKLDLF